MSIEEHIRKSRRDYSREPLDESMVDPDPFRQFEIWFESAIKAGVPDPHAMVVATVSRAGNPSARVVLLRGFERNGFVFYTNYQSHKGSDLLQNPNVAAVFFWSEIDRQIRIEGQVEKVAPEESDKYFHSRPRESQMSAWASDQSKVVVNRAELDKSFEKYEEQFAGGPVPRPDKWGGFRMIPTTFEFWQGRPNRMHDRILYELNSTGRWEIKRLAP